MAPNAVLLMGTPTSGTYTLSLHDALPIFRRPPRLRHAQADADARPPAAPRLRPAAPRPARPSDRGGSSHEHPPDPQSLSDLACRLLLANYTCVPGRRDPGVGGTLQRCEFP